MCCHAWLKVTHVAESYPWPRFAKKTMLEKRCSVVAPETRCGRFGSDFGLNWPFREQGVTNLGSAVSMWGLCLQRVATKMAKSGRARPQIGRTHVHEQLVTNSSATLALRLRGSRQMCHEKLPSIVGAQFSSVRASRTRGSRRSAQTVAISMFQATVSTIIESNGQLRPLVFRR